MTSPSQDSPGRTLLHRRALLAGLVSAPAVAWAAAPAVAATSTPTAGPTTSASSLAVSAAAPVDSSPTSSAPSATPSSTPAPTPLPTAAKSPNGWKVGSPASSIGVKSLAVAGTGVVLPVSSLEAASTVLLYVARRFHAEVQPLGAGCWGYSYRVNVNDPAVWSNHASGTAIDLNAPLHPNGAVGTFTPPQQDAIQAMLSDLRGVVRWGGNYRSTKDEMHFEINKTPGDRTLTAVADAITSGTLGVSSTTNDTEDDPMRNLVIAKTSSGSAVWIGDGMARRQVADLTELANLQYWMGLKGGDPTVHTIDDLRILGLPV